MSPCVCVSVCACWVARCKSRGEVAQVSSASCLDTQGIREASASFPQCSPRPRWLKGSTGFVGRLPPSKGDSQRPHRVHSAGRQHSCWVPPNESQVGRQYPQSPDSLEPSKYSARLALHSLGIYCNSVHTLGYLRAGCECWAGTIQTHSPTLSHVLPPSRDFLAVGRSIFKSFSRDFSQLGARQLSETPPTKRNLPPIMPPEPMLVDEDYASDQDSDFAPEAAASGVASDASDSESDSDVDATTSTSSAKRKRDNGSAPNAQAGDIAGDFENSGDEAIIHKGKKKQNKAKRKEAGDDEGGEGGLIKTRSMRAAEKAERKTLAVTGPVTINVDDLWASMIAGPVIPGKPDKSADLGKENKEPTVGDVAADGSGDVLQNSEGPAKSDSDSSAMIKIKRTYNFAGKVHTEEKLVPRDSAEAKLYLASFDPNSAEALAAGTADEDENQPRRPRKAFRSMFEPVVVEGLTQRSDLNLGLNARLQMREQAKAKKLNVVEKSRMDWAGFVDKEGIKDELELASKSKESYTNRQDFLTRVEANRNNEARRARLADRG